MRRQLALLLAPAILVQACATGAPKPPETGRDAAAVAAVNQALEDQPATLQLTSGEVVEDVEGLVMAPETTSWRDGDHHARTVPTAEVCKIVSQVRKRAGKGYAWGLLACTPVAAVSASSAGKGEFLDTRLLTFLVADALCAFVGMVVAAGLKRPPDRVVYLAPGGCGKAR